MEVSVDVLRRGLELSVPALANEPFAPGVGASRPAAAPDSAEATQPLEAAQPAKSPAESYHIIYITTP